MLRGRPLAWNWSENVQKMSRDPPIRVRFQVRGFLARILPVAGSRRSLMQNTLRYQVHDTTSHTVADAMAGRTLGARKVQRVRLFWGDAVRGISSGA